MSILKGKQLGIVELTGSLFGTSSYAVTASYAMNGGSGAGSTFPFSGSAVITGSLLISGSETITGSLNVTQGITGSLFGTSSWSTNAITASYVSSNFQYEIHVSQVDGNDTTGNGDLLKPVATIGKALSIVSASVASTDRRTIIVHPGTYIENITVNTTNTYFFSTGLLGANCLISGSVTVSAATRMSGLKMTNLIVSSSAPVYINNCAVDKQMTVSGSGYLEVQNTSLQCTSGIQVVGPASSGVIFENCSLYPLTVNNASAAVYVISCNQAITPTLTAGALTITRSTISSLTSGATSTALTTAAGSVLVLESCNVYNSLLTSHAAITANGFYSIKNIIYNKPASTLASLSGTGGPLATISQFQYINADNITTSGLTVTGSLNITGSTTQIGNINLTGSLNITQGITGSLFGTASRAISAATASFVNQLNQNVVITGSLSNGLTVVVAGSYSHAEGLQTQTVGTYSHAEGQSTQANGVASHAEGYSTQANGIGSHAEGISTTTTGDYSHAEGANTAATAYVSHAEGTSTQATGDYSHAEGNITIAAGEASHAEGNITKAIGDYSHAEGDNTQAVGNYSHSEGQETITSGSYSHAEGYNSQAIGTYSHAEGYSTKTGTQTAHEASITSGSVFINGDVTSLFTAGNYLYLYDVEFGNTYQYASFLINSVSFPGPNTRIVLADNSVNAATAYVGDLSYFRTNATFGGDKTIPGNYSHTEGQNTIALGLSSHAEGQSAQAIGIGSHAEGYNTQAVGNYQHVQGTFNLPLTSPSAFILGNGTDDANRSNLIFASGSEVQITGSLNVTQGITGDLTGTATNATNATTAATASYVLNAVSASRATSAATASLAQTASFVNRLNQNVQITGSLNISGSLNVSGSLTALADGNVGIGTITPAVKLHVSGAGSEAVRINGTGATQIVVQAGSLTGGPGRIEIQSGTNNNSYIRLGSSYLRESSGFLTVANAIVVPTATLQIRGSGATSATRALLVQNSTPVDILTIFDNKSVNISGSVTVTGSLLISPSSSFTLPTTQSAAPAAGTAYFSNNFLYVYNGSAWRSASLS